MQNNKYIKIALAWGWTWWHITPLVSIYKYLEDDRCFDFFWIWENWWLEESVAKKNNIRFFWIKAWKLRRYFSIKTFIEPFYIILWIIKSYKVLSNEKPDIIFSKWWYVSLPVAIAAKFVWVKLFLHESDSIPWLANRFVAKFATKVYLWFEDVGRYFNKDKVKVIGQILNPELFKFNKNSIKKTSNKTCLLVIWWSQWSKRIFEFILNNISEFMNFEISLVLGSQNSNMSDLFKKYDFVSTYDYISQEELKDIYYKSDIAITRAWATSLAELESFWIKMIIIPLTESANNHQYHNAISYNKKWEIMISENDFPLILNEIVKINKYKKVPSSEFDNRALEIIKKDLINQVK